MKKNKGFTLIELLAVIVILAIIALIAVPTVMKILESSRKAAFKQSAIGVLDSINIYRYSGDEIERDFDVLDIHVLETKNLNDKYKGSVKNIDGKYYIRAFTDGEFCILNGTRDNLEIVDASECENFDDTALNVTLTTSATTSSITVTAEAEDDKSEISSFQFYLYDGDNKKADSGVIESNSYTFENLTDNHQYKVEVIVTNTGVENTTASASKSVMTKGIGSCEIGDADPSGWSQSKKLPITFSGQGTYLIRPSVNVFTSVAATTCTSVENAAFTCNGAEVAVDGVLVANTWYKVTSSPTLTFVSNGNVRTKVTDVTNYIDGATGTISQIDRSAPTSATFTTSTGTNSITVTASGIDDESGIVRYQFSKDGGTTWLPSTTNDIYTFSGLTAGSYEIGVRVINGTYDSIKEINSLNTTASEFQEITTTSLATMSAISSPSGYAQSKTGTITFTGSGTYLIKPSVSVTTSVAATTCTSVENAAFTCNGAEVAVDGVLVAETWYKVTSSPTLTFTDNGSLKYKVSDGLNYIDGGSLVINGIDRIAPTSATFTTSKTTNSITVTASGTDDESGIYGYQFSKDGGTTWLPSEPQTGTSYTFSDLTSGSYDINVRVINGTYPNAEQNDLNTTEGEIQSTSINYKTGDALTLGGYKWHVVGDDGTNVTLMMDSDQSFTPNMSHYSSSTSSSTLYDWKKSLIKSYLDSTVYSALSSKITNMVSVEVCADTASTSVKTYGGYLMSQVTSSSGSCSNVINSYVRLITVTEFNDMRPSSIYPSSYVNSSGISHISESDYTSWLNPSTLWLMSNFYTSGASNNGTVGYCTNVGYPYYCDLTASYEVRPVITIKK